MWNDMTGQIKMKSEDTRKYKESVRNIEQIVSTLYDIQNYLTLYTNFEGVILRLPYSGKKNFQYFNNITFQRKEKKEVW